MVGGSAVFESKKTRTSLGLRSTEQFSGFQKVKENKENKLQSDYVSEYFLLF